jgi:hypothetical protein
MSARITRSQAKALATVKPKEVSPKRVSLRQTAKPAKNQAKQSGNQFVITYVFKYRGEVTESKIFSGTDESTVALAAFNWIFENGKGFCFERAHDSLLEEGDHTFEGWWDLSDHVRNTCKSIKDLKKICKRYGDSYFEDSNGWKLKYSKM